MPNVLAIDSDYDTVTRYLQAFRRKLVFKTFLTDYPAHAIDYRQGKHANRLEVDKSIGSGADFVTGAGHGQYDAFTGQGGVSIWTTADNLSYLAGLTIHLLSCESGAWLGRLMVQSGVKAFWGYTTSFAFYHQNLPSRALESDTLAERFIRMDIIVLRGILAKQKADQIMQAVARYFGVAHGKFKSGAHQSALLDNYIHLVGPGVTWGDPNATI